MKLDLSVLEDVRREFETSQDITIRPVLQKIRKLRRNQFSAINLLCACDGQASFDQIWSLEYLFYNDKRWTKEGLYNELLFLENEGILLINNNLIKFNGDDFDKIYTKYFSGEQRVALFFPEFSFDKLSFIRMDSYLRSNTVNLENLFGSSDIEIEIETIILKLSNVALKEDIFVEEAPYLKGLYFMMIDYRNQKYIPIIDIKLMLPWGKNQSFYYSSEPNDNSTIELCLGKLNDLIDRIKDIGGSLIFNQLNIRNVPIDILSWKVEATGNERVKNELAEYHVMEMVDNYCQKDNAKEAGFHANLAIKYAVDLMPSSYNNLGYYFMQNGDLFTAKGLFTRGIDICHDVHLLSLMKYNLAVLDIKEVNYEQAMLELKDCIELLKDSDDEQRKCFCVIVPTIINDQIRFEENRSAPDLRDIAIKISNCLESHINKKETK